MLDDLRLLGTGRWPSAWTVWPLFLGRVWHCSLSCQLSQRECESLFSKEQEIPHRCAPTLQSTNPAPHHTHTSLISYLHKHGGCLAPAFSILIHTGFSFLKFSFLCDSQGHGQCLSAWRVTFRIHRLCSDYLVFLSQSPFLGVSPSPLNAGLIHSFILPSCLFSFCF